MKILINALGIQDSGGIHVLKKLLNECYSIENSYLIVCNDNVNIHVLIQTYQHCKNFNFHIIQTRGFSYRLYYENFIFKNIIKEESIDLVYNFSGTTQVFLKTPQLLKVQNLLFYTKILDKVYKKQKKYITWLKQIYLKRLIFNFMSSRSRYIEIQSSHVKEYMSDFIEVENKTFFVKSDIDVCEDEFDPIKKYDFGKKVKFLYIVGPHFEYVHKNFIDFTNAMLELQDLGVDFEINITLSKNQLHSSSQWDTSLDERTNFLAYISSENEMQQLFCDNTIVISTSVIETLGLHVIEAIKMGVLCIAPNEKYSYSVYGKNILTYNLFDVQSLLNIIFSIIEGKIKSQEMILTLQHDLKVSENAKYKSIVEIFEKVMDNEAI